jgi:hypothetical protein
VLLRSLPQHRAVLRPAQQATVTPRAAAVSKQQPQLDALASSTCALLRASTPNADATTASAVHCCTQQDVAAPGDIGQAGSRTTKLAKHSQPLSLSPDITLRSPAANNEGGTPQFCSHDGLGVLPPSDQAGRAAVESPSAVSATTPGLVAGTVEPGAGWVHSGFEAEWGHLLRSAKALLEEIAQNDYAHPSYRPSAGMATAHLVEARYHDVVCTSLSACSNGAWVASCT